MFGLESEPSVEPGSNWSFCLCIDANSVPYYLGAEGKVIPSGSCRGRPSIPTELRPLVRQRWQANPTRGSPCIVGDLKKLGIDIAKSTVEKYRPKLREPTLITYRVEIGE